MLGTINFIRNTSVIEVMRLRLTLNERCLYLFCCLPEGLAARVPNQRSFAPQAVCANGAYASPKTLIVANYGFVVCVTMALELHVLRVLAHLEVMNPSQPSHLSMFIGNWNCSLH